MNEIIAIICEYNPFHNGHKHQIDKIKEKFPNSTIIAIMSGNVVQRGEFSMLDKYTRAKVAVINGVNAVFELPYPFSSSNAEIFALAGAAIADKLGATHLCFGSESDNLEYLYDIANTIDSQAFEDKMQALIRDKRISYISAKEQALKKLGKQLPTNPNDMLAVEYLRAIRRLNSKMLPISIKREGAQYNSVEECEIMSATAIRKAFYERKELLSMPENAIEILKEELSNGRYLNKQELDQFLFRYALIANPELYEGVFDAPWESGYFIFKIAKKASSASEFFDNLCSKTYTHARLRRTLMYLVTGVIGVSTDNIFTSLLASDDIGRDFIKKIRKGLKIVILTKQADAKKLSSDELQMLKYSQIADELFMSFLKTPISADNAYKRSPVII
ncbi:MAG: nucleotidyltransferase family protein [Clostridia bacterium]|nr:nucleotidyltransferase family protein [Clostridia bacterium]